MNTLLIFARGAAPHAVETLEPLREQFPILLDVVFHHLCAMPDPAEVTIDVSDQVESAVAHLLRYRKLGDGSAAIQRLQPR